MNTLTTKNEDTQKQKMKTPESKKWKHQNTENENT